MWNKIKQKLNRFKKWLIALLVGGVVFAGVNVDFSPNISREVNLDWVHSYETYTFNTPDKILHPGEYALANDTLSDKLGNYLIDDPNSTLFLRVRNLPLGNQVQRNGYMAYDVFREPETDKINQYELDLKIYRDLAKVGAGPRTKTITKINRLIKFFPIAKAITRHNFVADNAAASTSLTKSFDVGSDTNRVLVVAGWGNGTITGVTYAGVSLTEKVTVSPNNVTNNEIWATDDPTVGSNNVVMTQTGAGSIGFTAVSYNSATTTSAVSDTTYASQDDPTISITTNNNDSYIVDNIDATQTLSSPGAGQSQMQNVSSGEGWNHGTSDEQVTTAGAYTQSWTTTAAGAVDYSAVEVTDSLAASLADYQESTWGTLADCGANETTGTATWKANDLIIVVGGTESDVTTLSTPTATGLTFSLVVETGGIANSPTYLWSATAGSDGSSAVSATNNGLGCSGISVFVYRDSDGLGNNNFIEGVTDKTISLTRGQSNSSVVVVLLDFNATADVTTDPTPSGGVEREEDTLSLRYTWWVTSWGNQGSAGTTSYGITNHTGDVDMSGIVVEIKNKPSGKPRRLNF